jgi:hypothetical protein
VVLTRLSTLGILLICKSSRSWDCCAHYGLYSPLTVTETTPANKYWAIEASFRYGNASATILNTTAGIVDTGTPLIGLATGKLLRVSYPYQVRVLSHITYVRRV